MKSVIAAFVLFVSMVGIAHGQMTMGPAPEMKDVDFLVGHFKGTANFYFNGQKSSGPCEANTERVMNKCFVQSHIKYSMTMPGMSPMDMAGMHLLTYDAKTKQYVSYWFDSTATNDMHLKGNFDNGKLVLVSEPTDIEGMGKVVMRSTWWKNTNGSVGFGLDMQQGEKWVPMMDGSFKKA